MNLKSISELSASSCLLNEQASNMKCKNVLFISGEFICLLNKDWNNHLFNLGGYVKWALGPSGVCVRCVCRPFAIWMTRFSNQRICWPSLLRSPLLCCHILPSPLSSVSVVRRQAAAEESSISADVWTSCKAFIHGPCLPTHYFGCSACLTLHFKSVI